MATVGLRKQKVAPFYLTEADRRLLEHAPTDVRLWAQYYFEVDLRPWQEFFLLAPQLDKLAVAGIRAGKSFISSLGFLWFGMLHPQARLLNTSISSEQANIVYYNCLTFCQSPRFQPWVEKEERHPYPMIRLVNGTEMWFRSIGYEAELVRGFEFDLINVDEAGYVTREMAIQTLKGRLLGINPLTRRPRHGLFWMISTPKGKGWLYERWKRGDPAFPGADPAAFLSIKVSTYENTDLMNSALGRGLIETLRREYSDRLVRQELEADFLDHEDVVFPYDQILYACNEGIHPEVRWLVEQIEGWRQKHSLLRASVRFEQGPEDFTHYEIDPEPGHEYVQSWDLGKKPRKSGRNAMVGMVWDVTEKPFKLVGYRYAPGAGYGVAHEWIKEWHQAYRQQGCRCDTVIDATGSGEVLNERLEEEDRIAVEGVVYSTTQKPALIHAGQLALEKGIVRFPFIKRFVDQLQNYDLLDQNLPQDIVMAFCQAMHWARQRFGEGYQAPRHHEKAVISAFRREDSRKERFVQRRQAARTSRRRR